MRIRQVKPSFWTDARMAALPAAVRLFYIGLWMVADDGGWLRWSAAEVSNELYGYESRKRRERDAQAFMDRLLEVDRVTLHPCGHAFIPALAGHQRLAGSTRQVHTFENEHLKCAIPRLPDDARDSPRESSPRVSADPRPVRLGKERVRSGTVSQGQVAPAQKESQFDTSMRAAGQVVKP